MFWKLWKVLETKPDSLTAAVLKSMETEPLKWSLKDWLLCHDSQPIQISTRYGMIYVGGEITDQGLNQWRLTLEGARRLIAWKLAQGV